MTRLLIIYVEISSVKGFFGENPFFPYCLVAFTVISARQYWLS